MNTLNILLLLHLVGVIVWLGGMFFANFCLRPAAAQLPPPQRLPLLADALGRFFRVVAISIVLILASGFTLLPLIGSARLPVHMMMGLGLIMAGIFARLWFALYPRLTRAVGAQDWPSAGALLERIRHLVIVNLALGLLIVALVLLGR